MRLGDMTFEESRNAELMIAPIAEKIMKDKITSKVFDDYLGAGNKAFNEMNDKEKKAFLLKRVESTKELTKRLIHEHYEDTCKIFAILNNTDVDKIKEMKRSDVNTQLIEMLQDSDMQSFFMSSNVLAEAVLSVI